jgi:hypothetical protein
MGILYVTYGRIPRVGVKHGHADVEGRQAQRLIGLQRQQRGYHQRRTAKDDGVIMPCMLRHY